MELAIPQRLLQSSGASEDDMAQYRIRGVEEMKVAYGSTAPCGAATDRGALLAIRMT